eukprot:scaffold10519_cov58-Phaeocystis_antarctica.AAC.2
MDDEREKHPVCHKCRKLKLPTTYWCCVNCPGNPGAMQLHMVYHKEQKRERKRLEDGGVGQQRHRELAEREARRAAQTGDTYQELLAEGIRYDSQEDWRRAARAYREAIALRPNEPEAYFNLGNALNVSGHYVEAAQRYLDAKARVPVGSEHWAQAMAMAFDMLKQEACAEVAKPEWWNDEELKALSARVVRAAPNAESANQMRAIVLRGHNAAWEAGPRSAAEYKKSAAHYERAAALCNAPVVKAEYTAKADWCRSQAAPISYPSWASGSLLPPAPPPAPQTRTSGRRCVSFYPIFCLSVCPYATIRSVSCPIGRLPSFIPAAQLPAFCRPPNGMSGCDPGTPKDGRRLPILRLKFVRDWSTACIGQPGCEGRGAGVLASTA